LYGQFEDNSAELVDMFVAAIRVITHSNWKMESKTFLMFVCVECVSE